MFGAHIFALHYRASTYAHKAAAAPPAMLANATVQQVLHVSRSQLPVRCCLHYVAALPLQPRYKNAYLFGGKKIAPTL